MTEDQRLRHREANRRYRDRMRREGRKKHPPSSEARERKNAKAKESRRGYYWQYRLWTIYKMTVEDYERLLEAQGGGCAICLRPPRSGQHLDVDHDHACCYREGARHPICGKCVRGLLCRGCNSALALLDDREKRARAFAYLRLKDSMTP